MGAVRGWALSARRAQRSKGTERSVSLPFGVVEKPLKSDGFGLSRRVFPNEPLAEQ